MTSAGPRSAVSPTDAADSGPGSSAAPDMRLVFSSRCGRVRLTNVTVRNAGIDWEHANNVYWRHMVRLLSILSGFIAAGKVYTSAKLTIAGALAVRLCRTRNFGESLPNYCYC